MERGAVDDRTTRYALDVIAGRIVAGPWVRLAAERHLEDLERDDITWDLAAAQRIIRFFATVLRLPGGEFEGKPFLLADWQAFVAGSLFGWKMGEARRFRTAYVESGKGSGKTPFAAGIGHYLTAFDGEMRAEVYAAAAKKEQAQIVFADAVAMREQSPKLRDRLLQSGNPPLAWNLLDRKTGSFFRPISSDNKKSGARVSGAIVDEIHEHEDPNTINMIRRGTKGRRQPLIFEITNSGFDRTSVCWDHHDYSIRVLQKVHTDDRWFAYVCALDEGDQPFVDESCWAKANPNLGVSIPIEYLRETVNEAIGMPSIQNVVLRLNFCVWTEQDTIGIPADQWRAGEVAFEEEELAGRECFVGLDLSATTDVTGASLYFPGAAGPGGGKARSIQRYWIPGDDLEGRAKRDRAPWPQWVKEGWVTAIPGSVIRHEYVERELLQLAKRFRIREVAIDPYGALSLANQLSDHGFEVVQMQQSFNVLSPPFKELLRLLAGGDKEHRPNPVTRWMAANVAIEQRADGSIRPNKKRSAGRIDGIVAEIEAIDRASRHGMIPRSVYEDRHLYDDETGKLKEGAALPPRIGAAAPPVDTENPADAPIRARRSVYESDEWTQHREELER